MERSEYDRLKQLFFRASSGDREERAACLEAARRESDALADRLERMLEADSESGFIDPPERGAGIGFSPATEADLPTGTAVGAYVVERRLASGGMGDVFLACRADERFQRKVAVKVLRADLDTAYFLERFRREREALAALQHRYIAQLLDAGSLPDGRPYFVLEYVEGARIDAYCAERRLGLSDRLSLFVRICEAVEFAHGRLVVHSDLKPSNVLVTDTGEPRLLDFGIARMTSAAGDASRASAPGGAEPFTPEFASPEQRRGGALTTATDVFSLGVLLRVLLVSAASGARSRDLRSIVAQAARADPSDRYASVADLAADVARFLARRPVVAHPASAAHRARLWLRRNRALASVAVAGAVVVVAAFAVVVRSARSADRQRAEAESAARAASEAQERAERVTELLGDLLAGADPYAPEGTATLTDFLAGASRQIDARLEGEPDVEVEVRAVLGRTYHGLGLLPEARAELERALQLRRELSGRGDPRVAELLSRLGGVHYATADWSSATAAFEQALEIQEARLGPNSLAVARTLNDLGATCRAAGDLARAEASLRRSLELRRELAGRDSLAVAESLTNLGNVARHRGDLEAAEEYAGEALVLRERRLPPGHPLVHQSRTNLAVLRASRGALEVAASDLRRAVGDCREALGADHPDLARALDNLAAVLSRAGRPEEAEAAWRECLAIREERLPEADFLTLRTRVQLGACLAQQARYEAALRWLEPALAGYSERLSADDPRLLALRDGLARSYAALGRDEDAAAVAPAADESRPSAGG